jgi:hypothetical protein
MGSNAQCQKERCMTSRTIMMHCSEVRTLRYSIQYHTKPLQSVEGIVKTGTNGMPMLTGASSF